ncbi:MAG: menaquinone biosynthetic enzyme MqnA/MqnD family protein [Terriglobales bacterium]
MLPLRIAAIEFLNAAPLMWGLEADARFSMVHTLPSACADRLRDGSADLGVIPVIELARIPGLVALQEMGVASCDGEGAGAEVRSILLLSRCPLPQVRTLALDRASRTSAALAQILLRQRFGAEFTTCAGDADWRRALGLADAVLLIGDPALRLRISGEATAASGVQVHDLALIWREWTGLPFVFALWAVRTEPFAEARGWLRARLLQALEQGIAGREELVATWAPRLFLPPQEIRRYLTANVAHRISARHVQGLRQFFSMASEADLVPRQALTSLVTA